MPFYTFGENQVAVLLSGRSLNSYLKEKGSTMGPEKWDIWVAGKGSQLAGMVGSFAKSENLVFMVLRWRD